MLSTTSKVNITNLIFILSTFDVRKVEYQFKLEPFHQLNQINQQIIIGTINFKSQISNSDHQYSENTPKMN